MIEVSRYERKYLSADSSFIVDEDDVETGMGCIPRTRGLRGWRFPESYSR
jgi:hypothetical protein